MVETMETDKTRTEVKSKRWGGDGCVVETM